MKILQYELPLEPGIYKVAYCHVQYPMHCEVVNNLPFAWFCVDPNKSLNYMLHVMETSEPCPDSENTAHIGTCVLAGGRYVLHYYLETFENLKEILE